jgi:all-trans-nonaprenyl-diphosphate synthase
MCGHAGYEQAKELARKEGDLALLALECLPACEERTSLEAMVDYVLERIY